MDRLFGELKRRGATTFEVTEDANTKYRDRMTELLGDSLWTIGNCATSRSYYFNPRASRRCCGRCRRKWRSKKRQSTR